MLVKPIKAQSLPIGLVRKFGQGAKETKLMYITGRLVRSAGQMVKLLPLELGHFYVCDPGHVLTHVIMEQNRTFRGDG
ncbi:hypothetical protein TNCV_4858771 [Trichonephila clavipes]|nr:hypothetical protein TNCV_4858771 [Trichonephila clavipes]